ncbi:MAG: MFS transporter [Pseudochelatococcus sp.]|jgi:predicted MFS family arabinose efflux permease|uniref:MFS transporter n=1 Tax=Pseudochelatococcus sp. TaxID=2020869 RepID=UPI003D8EA045
MASLRTPSSAAAAPAPHALGFSTVFAMAAVCAFAVANTYYNQPMMVLMARDLGAPETSAGFITTATQAGYTIGLALLAPLGDRFERRGLILRVIGLLVLALLAASAAPTFPLLLLASFCVGMFSIVAQYTIPMAAALSPPETRGSVIGIVMAGLLTGILGARALAGLVADLAGWRAMFLIAAAMMVLVAGVVRFALPPLAATSSLGYGALLRSLLPLWREEPVLREATVVAAFAFATFNVFWTTLTPHLASPELGYGPTVAGLFGLIGLAGALTATIAGRLADHIAPRAIVGGATVLLVVAFAIMGVSGHLLIGLVVGVIVLDIGLQGVQIASQTRIFALQPQARNRVNTIFMTAYFIGGTSGSFIGTLAWRFGGWPGVALAGTGLAAAGIAFHLLGPRLFSARS